MAPPITERSPLWPVVGARGGTWGNVGPFNPDLDAGGDAPVVLVLEESLVKGKLGLGSTIRVGQICLAASLGFLPYLPTADGSSCQGVGRWHPSSPLSRMRGGSPPYLDRLEGPEQVAEF